MEQRIRAALPVGALVAAMVGVSPCAAVTNNLHLAMTVALAAVAGLAVVITSGSSDQPTNC